MGHAEGAYYVPHGSRWPMVGSVGLTTFVVGLSLYLNGSNAAAWVALVGAAVIIFMMFGWFGTVIKENVTGLYKDQEDASFRWGMIWFIFSEVMFFGAFFGALFYFRQFSIPWLGGDDPATSKFLWDSWTASWPTAGPGMQDILYTPMHWFPLPAINTALLLMSGVTITIAHHALKDGHRGKLVLFMWATVALGTAFLCLQAFEYYEAYAHLNLKLTTGAYGTSFFMLTGFHGMHVLIGTICLIVITLRCMKGHFSADNHFGFEAVAWYWHFVDVVWLGLFIFVYILI